MRARRTVLVLTAGALLVVPTAAPTAAQQAGEQVGEQVVRPSRLTGRPVEATDEGAPNGPAGRRPGPAGRCRH